MAPFSTPQPLFGTQSRKVAEFSEFGSGLTVAPAEQSDRSVRSDGS
jgi:hypothetical protein